MTDNFVATRTLTSDLSLTDALMFFKEKMLLEINTIILGKVIEVDNSAKRLSVRSLINGVDSKGLPISPPTIYDVPYGSIRGGNAGIITEYKIGDNVIIGFCQRQIDNTKKTEAQSTPSIYRVFYLQDAIVFSHWSNSNPEIYLKITDDEITIQATTKPITITTTGNTTINANNATINATNIAKIQAPTIELDGNINMTGTSVNITGATQVNGTFGMNGAATVMTTLTAGLTQFSATGPSTIDGHPFDEHAHSGVETGTGTTGGVV